jgi:hypothetical protein
MQPSSGLCLVETEDRATSALDAMGRLAEDKNTAGEGR